MIKSGRISCAGLVAHMEMKLNVKEMNHSEDLKLKMTKVFI
jgi:hypothetical protein